jgi:hypothetical protein
METTEITCPDCGKVIAPAGSVADARRCRCAEQEQRRATGVAVPAKPSKSCYVCGEDLVGKKRLKDHLGRYWCQRCADADERAKKREGELRCPDCSRVFPDHKLVYFGAERVCQSCYKEREKALEKKITKAAGEKIQKGEEINKIKWLAIIGIGLIVVAALFKFLHH